VNTAPEAITISDPSVSVKKDDDEDLKRARHRTVSAIAAAPGLQVEAAPTFSLPLVILLIIFIIHALSIPAIELGKICRGDRKIKWIAQPGELCAFSLHVPGPAPHTTV
jgi:hypothetical protein